MLTPKHGFVALALLGASHTGLAAQNDSAPVYVADEIYAGAPLAAARAIEQQALPGKPLWQGADFSTVEKLLAGTQAANLPQSAQNMLIELLYGSNSPPGAGENYLALRLATLGRIGALGAVAALSKEGLNGPNGAAMAEGYIGATLLDSGLEGACNAQVGLETSLKRGPHWARLEAVCFALADQTAQADLALEIVAEAQTPDPTFDRLYAILAKKADNIDLPGSQTGNNAFSTALHLAMASVIGADPTLLGLTPDQIITRPTLVRAQGAALAIRIFAAEQALVARQISNSELGALYASAYAELSGEGESSLPEAIQDAALHYNVIRNPQLGLESAAAIAAAFREAAQRNALPAVALLYKETLANQDATRASEEDAAIIARGLLSIGVFETAKPWFMVTYRSARDNNPGAFERMNQAWPLMAMANTAITPRGIEKLAAGWLSTLQVAENDKARRQAVLLFTLLEGFGRPVDESLWPQLLPGVEAKPNHMVDHTLWRGMEAAAARGERGLALMLLLSGLSQAPIADQHPAYIASAVNVLSKIGMAKNGHELAVDALLAAGF